MLLWGTKPPQNDASWKQRPQYPDAGKRAKHSSLSSMFPS
jgi:hypothetical protein